MAESAARLVDHVFPDVPIRQWVISFPWRLRCLQELDSSACRRPLESPSMRRPLPVKDSSCFLADVVEHREVIQFASFTSLPCALFEGLARAARCLLGSVQFGCCYLHCGLCVVSVSYGNLAKWTEHLLRTLDEVASELSVPSFGDTHLWVAPARLALPGAQAKARANIATTFDALWVLYRQDEAQRGQSPYAVDLG